MNRFINILIIIISVILINQPLWPQRQAIDKELTAFTNVNILPMTDEIILKNMTLVVRDGKIIRIGKSGETKVPQEATIIDCGGQYLLPGLMDLHTHIRNKANLNLYIVNGITTVRNMNGTPAHLRWQSLINQGKLPGPKIYTAGPTTTSESSFSWRRVTTLEQAQEAVQSYAKSGYDMVKVYELPRNIFFAIMDEAKKFDLPVTGHYPIAGEYKKDLQEFKDVLNSGMNSVEHIEELYTLCQINSVSPNDLSHVIRIIKESNITVTTVLARKYSLNKMIELEDAYLDSSMTSMILNYVSSYKGLSAVKKQISEIKEYDAETRSENLTDIKQLLNFLNQLHKAGINIVPGTDSHWYGVIAGFSIHEELSLYSEAGLNPYQILRAATFNSAKALDILDRAGTIEVGKDADFIIVENNPLEDIGALKIPVGVMIGGRWFGKMDLKLMRETL